MRIDLGRGKNTLIKNGRIRMATYHSIQVYTKTKENFDEAKIHYESLSKKSVSQSGFVDILLEIYNTREELTLLQTRDKKYK